MVCRSLERTVPTYFFDIINAGTVTRDDYGVELADDDEARQQAIALLPDMARDEFPDGDQHEIIAKARNEGDEIVYEVSLALQGKWWPGKR
jgi:hypothetical protein